MTSKSVFQNTFTLRKSRVANYVDVINIAITLVETTFKDIIKVKRIKMYYPATFISIS